MMVIMSGDGNDGYDGRESGNRGRRGTCGERMTVKEEIQRQERRRNRKIYTQKGEREKKEKGNEYKRRYTK